MYRDPKVQDWGRDRGKRRQEASDSLGVSMLSCLGQIPRNWRLYHLNSVSLSHKEGKLTR